MTSPTILVTGQVPADSPATALAGRTISAPVETIEQMVARITEARQAGVEPSMQVIYTESRWNRVINPAAVATILPTIVATLAELTGHRTTSQAALIAAVLLTSLTGFAWAMNQVERNR